MNNIQTNLGPVPFQLTRPARKRHLTIAISEKGTVKVSAPRRLALKEIHSFLSAKSSWIERHLKKIETNRTMLARRSYSDGQLFLFLGKACQLRVESANGNAPSIDFNADQWSVYVPASLSEDNKQQVVKEKLVAWYRFQAQEVLGGRVFYYAREMGVTPLKITVRSQKRLWGSCHPGKRAINLNWQIILSPQRVIDYVVIHELCHLKFPNHSMRFWNLVAKYMPDFNESRRWLKDNHLNMMLP